MAHFACLSVPSPGHINPMAALARELIARGHAVTFVHALDAGPMLASHGLDFVRVAGDGHAPAVDVVTRDAGRASGPWGLRRLVRHWAASTQTLCETLPALLGDLSIDMVLTDQLEPAGGLVANHLHLPFVSIAAALPMNWEVGVPSPFVGWSFGESRWHRSRNVVSAFFEKTVSRPVLDVLGRFADEWHLPRGTQLQDYLSGYAQIAQLTPSLDFPRRALTRCFHYCGPLRDGANFGIVHTGRGAPPRAFASLGTLQGHRIGLFEDIARAASAEGLDLTIAHGGRLSPPETARLTPWAEVHDFVAQDEVLARSDLAILHGGLNSVLDALARGVPLVIVPLAFEQRAIAARVARAGAGLVCRAGVMPRRRLRDAIRHVLDAPRCAEAARRIGDEIRAAGGVRRAADIVEQVQSTRQPVLAG